MDGQWYRSAVIEVVVPGRQWKVIMVDWGSVDTVDAANIRPIPQDFMTLPKQAIKCALFGRSELCMLVIDFVIMLIVWLLQLIECNYYNIIVMEYIIKFMLGVGCFFSQGPV